MKEKEPASGRGFLYSYVIHHRPAPGFTPFNRAARGDSAGGATFGRRGLRENAPSSEGAPAVLPAVPNPGGAANPPRATANFGSPAAAPGMFHVPGAGGPLSRTTLPIAALV